MSFRTGLAGALRASRSSYSRHAGRIAFVGATAAAAYYAADRLGVPPLQPLRLDSAPAQPHAASPILAARADPDTSIAHPAVLSLGGGGGADRPLALVGLGVRVVSFLRVKVYSAAFYVEQAALDRLGSVEGFHTFTPAHLTTPPAGDGPQLTGEALIARLLDASAAAVRIVPVRNTDFAHMRDAFTRALLVRQKLARAKGELSAEDDERLDKSIQALKAVFPAGAVPKGKALLLYSADGRLEVSYEGRVLGAVADAWVARELVLAYFADQGAVSPKLKEDVARGLAAAAGRAQ